MGEIDPKRALYNCLKIMIQDSMAFGHSEAEAIEESREIAGISDRYYRMLCAVYDGE